MRGQALGVLEPGGRAVADLHPAPNQPRDVRVVHVHHVGELGVGRQHSPAVEGRERDPIARVPRGVRGQVHHPPPHPVPVRERLRPSDQRLGARAEAQQQRPAAHEPAAAVQLGQHRLVGGERLCGALPHAVRPGLQIPRPASQDGPHPEALHRLGHRGGVEERAGLAEGGGAGADHLDAGQQRGVLLVLRGHHRVERDQPVRQVAIDRDVVQQEPAVQVLREVHVGVDEARGHHQPATVDDAVRLARRPHLGRGSDLQDAITVGEDRAVGVDAAAGVHRDDGGVLDQDHARRWLTRWRWRPSPSIPCSTVSPGSR